MTGIYQINKVYRAGVNELKATIDSIATNSHANSMRVIPKFEDSGALPSDSWFDILEEIVSEVKLDDEGVVAPALQVSSNSGLPVSC